MSDTEKLAKILKGSQTNIMQTLKTRNGNYTKDPKETLECLLERHFPDKSEDEMLDGNHYQVTEEEIYKMKDFITVNKIKEAFKSFKPHRSPGSYGIKPLLLHALPNQAFEEIKIMYQECLITGELPSAWQQAKVVFIPKPGKDDFTDPGSFRPIS